MADDTERPEHPPSLKDELWGAPDEAPMEDIAVPPDDVWGPALGSDRSGTGVTPWRRAGRSGSRAQSREQQELESSLPPVTSTVEPAPTEFDLLASHLEAVRSDLTSALAELEARLNVRMGALVARVERLETDRRLERALPGHGGADGAHRGRAPSMPLAARLSEILVARSRRVLRRRRPWAR